MPQTDIGFLIKSINDKLKIQADTDLKNFDLTFTQSRVLAFLNSQGGQSTQKDIEVFLDVSHPTVVGVVSRMEQKGYVTYWLDEKDRRNKIVKLTDQAKAICSDLEHQIQQNEEKMLISLSNEEIDSLSKMLTAIYNTLSK